MNKNEQQRLSVANAIMRVEMNRLKEETVKGIPSFLDTFKRNRKQNIKCGKILVKSADHMGILGNYSKEVLEAFMKPLKEESFMDQMVNKGLLKRDNKTA